MTLLENNLIFVGSSIADSALMRYTRTSKTLDVTSKTAESVTDDDQVGVASSLIQNPRPSAMLIFYKFVVEESNFQKAQDFIDL